jgi:hypothetical protein
MLLEQLKKSSALLEGFRAEGLITGFALIGGLAVSTWSRPRATRDIDLLLVMEPAELPRFVAALEKAGIHAQVRKGGLDDPIPYLVRAAELDIIVAMHKLEVEAVAHSIAVDLDGMKVPVVAPEYLVIIKLKAGGPQDEIDAEELLAADVDKGKVRELAARFHVDRSLERLLAQEPL